MRGKCINCEVDPCMQYCREEDYRDVYEKFEHLLDSYYDYSLNTYSLTVEEIRALLYKGGNWREKIED